MWLAYFNINPDADLDWVDWYCEFEFWDNEWEKTTTWKVAARYNKQR